MGEQHRVATARALVVQETTTALVSVVDARRGHLYVEDAATAYGLAIAAMAAAQTDTVEAAQEVLARVMATAQAGVRMAQGERAPKTLTPPPAPEPVEVWGDDPWERSDWEPIRNDETLAAARAVARVYEFDCVGGNLHITIGDENVSDACLEGDAAWIERSDGHGMRQTDPARYALQQDAERTCVAALRPLSEVERMSAIRLACLPILYEQGERA